jgi:hypothetical protein
VGKVRRWGDEEDEEEGRHGEGRRENFLSFFLRVPVSPRPRVSFLLPSALYPKIKNPQGGLKSYSSGVNN